MRKYLLAVTAAAALTTPAMAQDVGPYVGVEGGFIVKTEHKFDIESNGIEFDDAVDIDYESGLDFDAIAGYDLGSFRAEAEIAYKRLKIDDFGVTDSLIDDFGGTPGQDITPDDLEVSDRAKILSGMVNLLFDLGGGRGPNFYAGGGAGIARVKALGEKDTGFAWQLIAGLRAPISETVEAGVKYRFFNAKADIENNEDGFGFASDGGFQSHSLMASLIFKLGAPRAVAYVPPAPVVVAPAPAPAPVATQRCYDGSVVPVTTPCPLPPQPVVPSRGERG